MKISKIIFVLTLFLVWTGPAGADSKKGPSVRVRVLSRHAFASVEVKSPEPFRIEEKNQSPKVWPSQDPLTLSAGSPSVRLIPASGTYLQVKLPNGLQRHFSGPIQMETRKNQLYLILDIPLERYVAIVLASEMPVDFPLEALKSQALLIRTKAFSHQKEHALEGFDFCDTTHCQAFNPVTLPQGIREAVRQTRGEILTYRGKAIETYYHSTCGGHTSPVNRVVGGPPIPYLGGVSDQNYCQDSPHARWKTHLSAEQIETTLNESPATPTVQGLKEIKIIDADSGGRGFQLALIGSKGTQISTEEFRIAVGRKLGWDRIKSNFFSISPEKDGWIFRGYGLGHGVGLCQWGARGMALAGKSYREILSHYFPGTRIQRPPLSI